jgi:hypothetical protein
MELVSINPLIKPVNPDGRWPRGRAFSANAQSAISRSSWDPNAPSCVVCGKGAHGLEEMRARGYGGWYHLDLDAGQVIIDGYGERLVVDLGSAGGYGPGNLKRTDSYGKGTVGHNVVMVGRRNTLELGPTRPRITASDFDDAKGGWWKVDLTGIYEGARCVERTVVYLHPGIVAVVDEVELEQAEEVSLRWHTADRCEPDAEGRFTIEAEGVRCVCRVARLDGEAPSAMRREHSYEPPYDVDYFGIKRPQLHESYVEAVVEDVKLSYLSLFCVLRADEVAGPWIEQSGIWSIPLPGGAVEVSVREPSIDVRNTGTGMTWTVDR